MVTLIRMGREFGYERLTAAVQQALDLAAKTSRDPPSAPLRSVAAHAGEPIEIGALSAYERPLPTMIEYDRLLQAVQA